MSKKSERYISNQEKVKTRAITRIFKKQKDLFIEFLEKQPVKSWFKIQKKRTVWKIIWIV